MTSIKRIFRDLLKDRFYFLVNLLSLTIVVICCSYLAIYLFNELTYDSHHEHQARIYRLSQEWRIPTTKNHIAATSGREAIFLKSNYPAISNTTIVSLIGKNPKLKYGENVFESKDFYRVSGSIIDVFTFEYVAGNKLRSLQKPGDLVISESWALRMFGTTDCLGKIVRSADEILQITGVFKDLPQNSDLNINGLIYETFGEDTWKQIGYYTYVLMQPSADEKDLHAILYDVSRKLYQENPDFENDVVLHAQPLDGLHFETGIAVDNPKGSLGYVRLFILTGLLLLIILFINLSNLNVIRTLDRMKNIAIHRLMGASKLRICLNFLQEITFIWVISVVIICTLLYIFNPLFTGFTGLKITAEHLFLVAGLYVAILLLCLLSGSYALIYLVKARPSDGLRKLFLPKLPGNVVRKYLVSFQLIITTVIISIFTTLLFQQTFMMNKEVGFSTEGVMAIEIDKDLASKEVLLSQLKAFAGNDHVSVFSNFEITENELLSISMTFSSESGEEKKVEVGHFMIDENYIQLMDIRQLSGMSPKETKNRPVAYINSTLANILADKSSFDKYEYPWGDEGQISGVIVDCHYQSLHSKITPLMMVIDPNQYTNWNSIHIKTSTANISEIKTILDKNYPNELIEISFLDQNLADSYTKEKNTLKLVGLLMFIGISISILGIYALISYLLKYKMLEIGVRRVLGANLNDFMLLFGKEFIIIYCITAITTIPFSLLLKQEILKLYAYQVDFSGIWFLAITLLLFALLTFIKLLTIGKTLKLKLTSILKHD